MAGRFDWRKLGQPGPDAVSLAEFASGLTVEHAIEDTDSNSDAHSNSNSNGQVVCDVGDFGERVD